MDISTVVVAVTGLGAALALYVGLRPSPAATPVPLPPEDADADDRYGLSKEVTGETRTDIDESTVRSAELLENDAPGPRPSAKRRATPRPKPDRAPGWDKTGARDLVIGLGLLAAAVLPLLILPNPLYALPITGVVAWIGVILVRRGGARQHGLGVERQARKSVKLPEGWTLDESVAVHGRGDADLVVTDPDGERYVVEIKANEAIQVRKSWFSSAAEVRGADGRKMPRDPLEQVTALAGILHAHPVLWFPKARTSSVVRIGRPEVLVVLGNWRQLRKAIGAGGGWFS